MEPEISHRCKTCGASVRTGAQFCHQCGGRLSEPAKTLPFLPETRELMARKREKMEVQSVPDVVDVEKKDQIGVGKKNGGKDSDLVPGELAGTVAVKSVEVVDGAQTKRQRVKDAAREMVADNVMPRVERLRHASSFVLEEASAIDPSLRFVLIALILFVFFLVLLLLSFIK